MEPFAAVALGVAAYCCATYVIDVPLRRSRAARAAHAFARRRGLPLLNVGAGTGSTALFGETLYGDINVDLGGRRDVPHGTPGVVTYADAHQLVACSLQLRRRRLHRRAAQHRLGTPWAGAGRQGALPPALNRRPCCALVELGASDLG